VIECVFSVLKHHFHILLLAPEYNINTQACIPVALSAIHNFIISHNLDLDATRSIQCWMASAQWSGDGIRDVGDVDDVDESKSEEGEEDLQDGDEYGMDDEEMVTCLTSNQL
jgi:hypothetical protein